MAEAKNEKAPGRRCLADQTPLSAWSCQAPLTELEWVVFDPPENRFRSSILAGSNFALQQLIEGKEKIFTVLHNMYAARLANRQALHRSWRVKDETCQPNAAFCFAMR
ncbi:MAG TPA: hypothetical protein VJS85_02840 [Rhizomicrobium sp.]|nr:hypothetical protein [Rhizomicrobium sp.]